jgi:hypothetical protein
MGHEMTESDRMYSVREAPWHMGTGTKVLMLDTAPETRMLRIDAADHGFTVEESDVYLRKEHTADEPEQPTATFPKVGGWKALTRSDTGDILNVARGSYEVVQNVVGHELFEALSKGAELDDGTGGTVKGGAVCYVITVLILSLLAIGSSAIFAYAHNVRARHGPGEAWKRLRDESQRISVCCLVLLTLGFLSVTLIGYGQGVFVFIGTVLGLGCLTLWSWIEIGPPGGPEGRTDLRSIVLTRLRATVGAVQYAPLERLLCDACLFAPWLIGAAVLYSNVGAPAAALLGWGVMILPCTAIMGIRKHEVRLLSSFGDQVLWLELHAKQIAIIRSTGTLPDAWN